ncbi:GGDEF domain-containing protein [Bacillus sp. M6-12]|uniref:tetratricopeptide repeat-containing diguanylate cyclase n=1 Tax=Bacillus sp. M6-12 TaxID=2054166 RepID=UPI000C776649|nr:GGDEF domain-containing protein [Bacillus sp. M6-12]PLS17106.1 GGDEF domain-containing protein [Bacillus sp. M6-12]
MLSAYKQMCHICQEESVWTSEQNGRSTCLNCLNRLVDFSGENSEEQKTGIDIAKSLAAILDILEVMPFRDMSSAVVPAKHTLSIAKRLGAEALEMRSLLVHADIITRQGSVAEGGRIFHEVNAWGIEEMNTVVIARSHRLLSSFFSRMGDNTSAFEHAVRAVENTFDNALPHIRADHLLILALTLGDNGAYDEADRRFGEVLDIAAETNDVQLAIISINNMAFTAYQLGDAASSQELVTRLRSIAEEHSVPLDAITLDTIARIEILLGRPVDSEKTLEPVLKDISKRMLNELTALPECLLTAAVAQRMQGALKRAQASLDKAKHLANELGLAPLRVKVRLEQAELFAAAGSYREAYEEHRGFHADEETLRKYERESRARILKLVFEAEEARRDSEHYREMALRDPLTNLHNRRYIDSHIEQLIADAAARSEPLTVAMLDLDNFKQINDTLSHDVGDAVLVHFARILTVTTLETAMVARIGGEEFLVILPRVDEQEGLRCAEELRRAVRSADWSPITGDLPVTVSIGVCTAYGNQACRSSLLSEADRNLYIAKRSGRDRVYSAAMSPKLIN